MMIGSLLVVIFSTAGCRRAAPPTFTRGSVQINALLSIHPAWSDVAELDQMISHASGLPATPPASSAPLAEATFPKPLPAGIDMPSTTPPPLAGSRRTAAERISQLRESLERRTERVLARERSALEKRAEAAAAVERSRLQEQEPPPVTARNPEDAQELRRLEFEFIALESQVRVLFEPALGEAQKRLNQVVKRIQELRAPPNVQQEVREAAIEKQVSDFRAARRQEMERDLGARREILQTSARDAVAEYRSGLRGKLAAATPPPAVSLPSAAPVSAPALASPRQLAAETLRRGQAQSLGTGTRLAALSAQRSRLVEVITEDLRRRVQGMAAQYHWTLVAAGGSAVDLTPQAAELLREQFKAVKAGS